MTRLLLALALALNLPGCGFLFVTIADATRGSPSPLSLSQSAHVSGRTGGRASHAISCGAASGSPQNEHAFVAAVAGTYTFDSATSDYDGVIAVYDAYGNELACNDDHGSTRQSEVSVSLAASQHVTVVQGGYNGASGSYEMWVTGVAASGGLAPAMMADGTIVAPPPPPPPQELPLATQVSGVTTGLLPLPGVTCPPTSGMQEWRFTAPAEGGYVFHVDATYDAYLGVIDELGTQIGCNDDFGSTASARVAVDLGAGSVVRVIVGGYASQSGSYTLTAVALSNGGPVALGQPVLFSSGSTSSAPDVCGAAAGSIDRTFTFTPRAEAFYAFHTDANAILVIDDGRRTAACLPLAADRRAGFVLKAGHRYSLVLELGSPDGAAHTFSIDRVDPDAPDWQAPPMTTIPLSGLLVTGTLTTGGDEPLESDSSSVDPL